MAIIYIKIQTTNIFRSACSPYTTLIYSKLYEFFIKESNQTYSVKMSYTIIK